jgi:transcriptional regulator with PAS, ATPase and Fis domain
VIKPDDLPVTSSGPARPVLFRDIECQAIDDALRDNDGNRTKTATQLGISLLTIHTV